MPRVILTEHATADLRRVYDFLAENNRQAAQKALKSIREAFDSLAQFPASGRFFDDIYREWTVSFGNRGYTVLYRIEPEAVVIVAVKHQREAGYGAFNH